MFKVFMVILAVAMRTTRLVCNSEAKSVAVSARRPGGTDEDANPGKSIQG